MSHRFPIGAVAFMAGLLTVQCGAVLAFAEFMQGRGR
jgi:hypothetical protein